MRHQSESLFAQEKIVVLLLNEVQMAQRVEYSDGSFIGLNEDGVPAKTVLTFIVQSICGKYRNVVCLIPAIDLDTVGLDIDTSHRISLDTRYCKQVGC